MRLAVIVEGQTEETFVNEILAPELGARSVFVFAHRITTKRKHGRSWRGGLLSWKHVATDLILWMKQDFGPDIQFTSMLDYYALPHDFPGYADLPLTDSSRRIEVLETAMATDIAARLPDYRVRERFIPYIQRHEFEALLFSNPSAFDAAYPGDSSGIHRVESIRKQFETPEDINDGLTTAPSKRIGAIWQDYKKPVAGLLIAQRIGLSAMRRECPGFGRWVSRLEALSQD